MSAGLDRLATSVLSGAGDVARLGNQDERPPGPPPDVGIGVQ